MLHMLKSIVLSFFSNIMLTSSSFSFGLILCLAFLLAPLTPLHLLAQENEAQVPEAVPIGSQSSRQGSQDSLDHSKNTNFYSLGVGFSRNAFFYAVSEPAQVQNTVSASESTDTRTEQIFGGLAVDLTAAYAFSKIRTGLDISYFPSEVDSSSLTFNPLYISPFIDFFIASKGNLKKKFNFFLGTSLSLLVPNAADYTSSKIHPLAIPDVIVSFIPGFRYGLAYTFPNKKFQIAFIGASNFHFAFHRDNAGDRYVEGLFRASHSLNLSYLF